MWMEPDGFMQLSTQRDSHSHTSYIMAVSIQVRCTPERLVEMSPVHTPRPGYGPLNTSESQR